MGKILPLFEKHILIYYSHELLLSSIQNNFSFGLNLFSFKINVNISKNDNFIFFEKSDLLEIKYIHFLIFNVLY